MWVNNKYMGNQFDPTKESHYLQYLDANSLYSWAMSHPLLTGRLEWVSNPESLKDSIIKLAKEVRKGALLEIGKGYLLEVDVSYPEDLHDPHNGLPLMCEKRKIHRVQKLVPNLYNKKKYVIYIAALNQALKHGLGLDKVHRAIEFRQRAWLETYIDFNTQLRQKVKNIFEKDFFKLISNSVFGKMIENIRKHKDINLVTNKEAYLKRVMKLNFKSGIQISSNLMGCEMGKIQVVMNKSVYLGQAIFVLSKIIMYEFHYDHMKPKYGKNLQLCYMDTDSFIYDNKPDDV